MKVGQQVFDCMTLAGKRGLVRKNSGNTFGAGGTSRSGGLPLLGTPNRISVYCSLPPEFSSPENKEDIGSDRIPSSPGGHLQHLI